MIVRTLALLALATQGWLLGPGDLRRVPTRTSPGTALRQEVEERYYATPFYERDDLARREATRTTGLARLLWMGLSPRWRGEARVPSFPQGNEPANDDREMLRARLLADAQHLYYAVYKPLLDRLIALPGSRQDYRLLRTASRSAFLIGGDKTQGLPLAKAAEALRPDDPTTWWTMKDTYYRCICYGVGNGRENWRAYLRYTDRCRSLALASKTPAGKEEAREIDIDRKWLGGAVDKLYLPDGTPRTKKP